MGLFSSKKVTQVATAVSRVIEDENIPSAIKTGSLKAFFQQGDLTEYMLEEAVSSLGIKAERCYTYAENHYTHGLPSGEVFSSTQGRTQVEAVIEAVEGQQVLMDYAHFGPPNTLHIGWMKLVSQYGYNPATNQLNTLTTQKGFPVYLKDMVVVVPATEASNYASGSLAQWGKSAAAGYTPARPINTGGILGLVAHSAVQRSTTAVDMHLKVTYVWIDSTKLLKEESLILTVQDYDEEADYFHAKYTVNGQEKYWMYQHKLGTYSTLDNLFISGPEVSGEYFPFVYFRYNKQDTTVDKTTAAYKTSKKLTKHLGLDYDTLATSINENPDIADVEQAMLMFGVPAVSTNAVENRYLFDYFNTLHYVMEGGSSSSVVVQNTGLLGSTEVKTTVIKDELFKMSLSNSGIIKRIIAGSIGSVGTYSSSYEKTTVQNPVTDADTGQVSYIPSETKTHTYRNQIAPGLYEEVTVRDLTMLYYVWGNYTTTGDESDDILLIPIDRSISKNYSIADRETLYARSLHLVFNSRVITKVKWYQQGWFKTFLIIVAIVIAFYTGGSAWGQAFAKALSLTGTAALIAVVIFDVVILGALLKPVFKTFVRVFGADLTNLLILLALAYGAHKVYNLGSVAGAPFAQEMLTLASGLQQAVLQDQFQDLLTEANEFQHYVDEQTKTLETANALLETSHVLNPFVIFGERPEDFYNRTVHSGNIGVLGINAISSYVDIALTLPKLNDTLGETSYD